MSDYRYDLATDVWVGDDHVIDACDMPYELLPEDRVELVSVRFVRDDAGQVTGALVWEPVGPWAIVPECVTPRGRWVPIA